MTSIDRDIDVDDIPWGERPEPRVATSKPKKCKHMGDRVTKNIAPDGVEPVYAQACARCDHVFDPVAQKRGRSSNNIAKDIERWVGKILRLSRVGQFGGQEDLGKQDEWAFVQVKSGPQWFSPKMYREIEALAQRAGRRRALVVVSKPGSSGRRQAMWVEILEEVPLPAEAVRWESVGGHLQCTNCAAVFPDHAEYCVHS